MDSDHTGWKKRKSQVDTNVSVVLSSMSLVYVTQRGSDSKVQASLRRFFFEVKEERKRERKASVLTDLLLLHNWRPVALSRTHLAPSHPQKWEREERAETSSSDKFSLYMLCVCVCISPAIATVILVESKDKQSQLNLSYMLSKVNRFNWQGNE